jgi:hypothetical protein
MQTTFFVSFIIASPYSGGIKTDIRSRFSMAYGGSCPLGGQGFFVAFAGVEEDHQRGFSFSCEHDAGWIERDVKKHALI